MIFRVLTRSLLAVLFVTSGKAQFEIRGSRLYLDGSPFTVRGVAYSPTPIGEARGPALRVSPCVYTRDFALAARAGINTLRIYGRLPAGESVFWQMLEQSSLYLLAGFPLEPYYDPGATLSPLSDAGRALRSRILQDFREYAAQLRDQRRVIALVFGNEVGSEYGRKFAGAARDFYSLLAEAAPLAGRLITTAVADTDDIGRDGDLPGLSFWSVNVYRGTSFGGLFDDLRRKTTKAALVSEFGIDAWDSIRRAEEPAAQESGLRALVRLLQLEMSRSDAAVFGGVWFGWSDEWWRGGPDPSRHGIEGSARPGFPDAIANPAWFGLFGVAAGDLTGLDSLRPRPAFAALAEEWGAKLPEQWPPPAPPRLSPQGVDRTIVSPGGLVSLYGEDLASTMAQGSASPLPLEVDLTSACIGNRPVPMLAVAPGQIHAQLPWETASGSASAIVYRAGAASNAAPLEVRAFAPSILDRGVIESGKPCPVSVASGVRPGAYLEVYGTGLGPVAAPVVTGVAAAAPQPTENVPQMLLGPRELRVLYSGLVPGVVGLYQTNTHVPEDFPALSPVGLRLLAGGLESNPYALTVLSEADRPGVALGPDNQQLVVQAGGPPQSAALTIEGQNGFCELVRFSVVGLPEGVSLAIPVGFPGQRVPVTVQASPSSRAFQDLPVTIQTVAPLPENPTARVRISVLPSRGDIPFRVLSGGGRAGLVARFEMAGRLLYQARGGGPGRGFSFLSIDGDTGVLGPARTFDTWLSERASEQMSDYLAGLPLGTVVLGAIADEGTLHLTPRARTALRQILRSQLVDSLRYQDSWAIMTRIGATLPMAEERASERQVVIDRVLTFPMP